MRIVIVGGGNAGFVHAEALKGMPRAELAAVVMRDGQAGQEFALRHGCRYYCSCVEAIEKEDFSMAAVCTSSSTHGAIALEFVRAGKHVIVEKPLDISLEAIDRLLAEARARNVRVCAVFQHRFDEGVVKIKRAVEEGKLGKLFYAACHLKSYRPQSYYADGRGTWAADGGGALMIQAIHYIDLLVHLMGNVREVYGICGAYAHPGLEVEDLGIAAVKYENGGAGLIEGTTAAYPGLYRGLDLYGSNGTVQIVNDKIVSYKAQGMTPGEQETMLACENDYPDYNAAYAASLRKQYAEAIDSIECGREPLVNGAEGRKAVEIALSIYESNRTNKPVMLNHQ